MSNPIDLIVYALAAAAAVLIVGSAFLLLTVAYAALDERGWL